MTRPCILALLLLLQPVPARANQLQYLGSFQNVISKDDGEHCSGYSLALWKYREHLVGLFDQHAGLCGDPLCAVIRDAVMDSKTGRLTFWSEIDGEKIEFRGKLTRDAVDGSFNRERARLARNRDSMRTNFEPDRSFSAWCKFWASVPRCDGVRELCESINAQTIKSEK